MRATKCKHYADKSSKTVSEDSCAVSKHSNNSKSKSFKRFKTVSIAFAVLFAASVLVIPTTTLAPGADAFENSKVASFEVGNIDDVSILITNNIAPETTTEATVAETKATETTKAEEKETLSIEVPTLAAEIEDLEEIKALLAEASKEETEEEEYEIEYIDNSDLAYTASGDYLINISNVDSSYSPTHVILSTYDRAKLERLVMGEAGSMGFNGCALVAQAIRDAMNRSNTTSIDTIISDYQYYAPTTKEPNQDVLDAVSYIFDQDGSAVQHRVLCFYTGRSDWHETQNFLVQDGTVRFFDLWVD